MSTPDYSLLKNLPQPDPIGSALGAYKTVTDIKRTNQAAALATQKAQLQIHSARRAIHDTRLADIHELPEGQKPAAWQNFRQEMGSLNGDVSKIPSEYGPEAAAESQTAYNQSPQGVGDRKYVRDVAMQQLKNAGAMQAAMAKIKAAPGEGQKQLAKSEAIANSKYKDSVIGDAHAASQILNDTDNIKAALGQAATGYTGSLTNWDTPAGQELKKHISQLVLDKLQGMHNVSRGTRLITKIIQRSKPADWMKGEASNRIIAAMAAVAHRTIEKERYVIYMWKHGVQDRGRLDTEFGDYSQKYNLINVKSNTVNTHNVGRWAEYLQTKQQAKAKAAK